MKLINADVLIKDLAYLKYSNEYGVIEKTRNLAIDECIMEIKYPTSPALHIETLDEAPVKHAHWIINTPQDVNKDPDFVCSSCYCISPIRGYTRYCPNCGAKMDGEVERRKKDE